MIFNFDARDRENALWRIKMRELPTGVSIADLKKGDKITVSPNLNILDRSYLDGIFEVLALNIHTIQVKGLVGFWKGKTVLFADFERHFYMAKDFEVDASE